MSIIFLTFPFICSKLLKEHLKGESMFQNRFDAAHQLAKLLANYRNQKNTVIIAIPRGGVEIGAQLAQELHLPLDVILVKKMGAPDNPEFAIGALTIDDESIDPLYESNPFYRDYLMHEKKRLRELLQKRYELYRAVQKTIDLKNKTIILVDDGIATGQTLSMALIFLKKQQPEKIIVALPVCAAQAVHDLRMRCDKLYCVVTPENLWGISQLYLSFAQVEDDQAVELLRKAQQ